MNSLKSAVAEFVLAKHPELKALSQEVYEFLLEKAKDPKRTAWVIYSEIELILYKTLG